MKTIFTQLSAGLKFLTAVLFPFFISSCMGDSKTLPVFDYTTDYPSKEFPYSLVFDIKYIPVETDSTFIDRLRVLSVTSQQIIGITGKENKFVFIDENGVISNSFSRTGNAKEEYLGVNDAFYDQDSQAFFVLDSPKKRILVLDKDGMYKREFPIEKGHGISAISSLNENYFISYNCNLGFMEDTHGSYSVLSKEDGSVIKDITIFCEGKKRYPTVVHLPQFISVFKFVTMIPADGCVLLSESYCDTVYKMDAQTLAMQPYLLKSPAFGTLPDQDKYFLEPYMDTPDYFLFAKQRITYDDKKANATSQAYFYDKKEGKFYKISNKNIGDFENYKKYGYAGCSIDMIDLMKMQDEGTLPPTLKPILSTATENDNPVLVIMSLKNIK
ncbi:MAG: 6-bladed beta-propeller [Bacteroidales bacterium]